MYYKIIIYIASLVFLCSSFKIYPSILSDSRPNGWSSFDAKESFLNEDLDMTTLLGNFNWFWWQNDDEDDEEGEKIFNPFSLQNIQGLEKKLQARIIGQDSAIHMTVAALERYANGLSHPNAPIAALLYVGPTGVGKTQLVKELAKILFGNEQSLIRLSMSEYSGASSVNRLIGSPPGYINHEEGGQFTKVLQQNSRAIVLLDEIEKAHPDVLKVFLQLFDEGFISDAQGNIIDCRDCLFILTTNLAQQIILTMHDLGHSNYEILAAIQPTIVQSLSPELYNRLEAVIFRGLKADVFDELVKNLLFQARQELFEKKQMIIEFDSSVIHFLQERATNYVLGARPCKLLIKQTVMTAITEAIKEKYIQEKESVCMSYRLNDFIIKNPKWENPFIWHWNGDKQDGIHSPFKLNQIFNLSAKLQQKILGQPYAIEITVASLMRYAAGLSSMNAPIGAFLYVGPTGVGKTQLAKELTEELLGSVKHLIRLDMSEYSEPHSVSRLIGSPPGYVNHEAGGQLTEALKQHPYAVVLLDEIEKAHPVVLKTFLQVFDEGYLSDAKGYVVDCRNVIFILTTNLTASKILNLKEKGMQEKDILEMVHYDIIKVLSPEFYNRLEVAIFTGLSSELCEQLIVNMLNDVKSQLQNKKNIQVNFDASVINFLKLNGYDYELGARPLKRLIQQTVVTSIAKEIIAGHVQTGDSVTLFYHNGEIFIEHDAILNESQKL